MKIGVLTVLLSDQPLGKVLKYLAGLGVQAVELGCGGYPGNAHCNAEELLASPQKIRALKAMLAKHDLEISALSMHGNPLHPDKAIARAYRKDQENGVRLAEKLGVDTVITFSGCPGDHDGAKYPNWVTCAWPPDYPAILKWQWEEKVIPYWQKSVKFARDHGVKKIGLEMHPGFVVYNPETLLRLREATGPEIGANFDPSHLFWQGIDVPTAIRELGKAGAMHHFHAKDTRIDLNNTRLNGVLDTKPYTNELERSWIFRSLGYGNSAEVWKAIISELRMVGYDGVLSIEHEDSLMSPNEGLEKGVRLLKEILVSQPAGVAYWA